MNPPPTSLDRLHDLALPPAVPWWPLAPGWYVVFAFVLLLLFVLARRARQRWQAHAYRRAALDALNRAGDVAAIAEVLRRTALATAPRPVIAAASGRAWADWLAAQFPDAMPAAVHTALATGVYRRSALAAAELESVRAYAARWIAHHQTTRC
jgi:hypothetical protein